MIRKTKKKTLVLLQINISIFDVSMLLLSYQKLYIGSANASRKMVKEKTLHFRESFRIGLP